MKGMLPTGQRWDGSEAQMHRIWCVWYQVTMIAINRGLGVAVEPAPDGVVEITTIGAPQWEEIRVAVHPDGALTHFSEQCAPDIDGPWVSPRADDREALLGAAERPGSFGLRYDEADIILHILADWRREEVKAIADRIRRVAVGDHVDVLTDEQRAIRWTRGEAAT